MPCGPNALCQVKGNSPACSCLSNYVGTPPNCRPECVISPDCPSNQACINNKCHDPCPGSCGLNAECRVISHAVTCICAAGFSGDPFVQCTPYKREYFYPPTLSSDLKFMQCVISQLLGLIYFIVYKLQLHEVYAEYNLYLYRSCIIPLLFIALYCLFNFPFRRSFFCLSYYMKLLNTLYLTFHSLSIT